ncbi:putative glycolipid-binding domain-containing protein [Bacillus spongiae]|uniref:Glycolipid-binding domain-containing protein n=1 Tax=Bacillus spongiae TaxID=2683610 RepID=A0ABU8HH68_9BACI
MIKEVFWESKEFVGCEYLQISKNGSRILAEGRVLFATKEEARHISYVIEMNNRWFTRNVQVYDIGKNKSICLQSDGKGKWFSNEKHVKEMDGAIDVDISVTPFSNTLPINRVEWQEKQVRTFNMIYIDVHTLSLKNIEQEYTYLGAFSEGRKFRYKCREYKTIITVDETGLVLDYPDLFSRRF